MCEIISTTSRRHRTDCTAEECRGHCLSLSVHGAHFGCECVSDTPTAAQNAYITSVKD